MRWGGLVFPVSAVLKVEVVWWFVTQVEKAKAQIAVEVYTAMTEALNAK